MKSGWFWPIVAGALALRLGLLASAWGAPQRLLTPDSHDYHTLAQMLARHGHFARTAPDDTPPEQVEIFRTPGYPVFLLTGFDGQAFSWRRVALIQIALDTVLVGLTYALGAQLVSRGAGLFAAAIQAVSPVAVAASCRILSDSLYAFGFTLAVLMMIRHFRTGRWRPLVAAAIALGLSCYVRPIGLVMAGVFVVVLLFGKKRLRRAGAFALVVAACVAPWIVRNAVRADYRGFSSVAGDSMYAYSAPQTLARVKGVSVESAKDELMRQELEAYPLGSGVSAGKLARYRRDRAMEIVLAHPGGYAMVHLKGCAGFFLPGATDVLEVAGVTRGQRGTLAVLQEQGLSAAARNYFGDDAAAWTIGILLALITLGVYAGVAVCAAARLRLRMSAAAWLILLLVGVSALLGGPASTPRFRVPVAPLLSVAAAAGWLAIARRFRKPTC